MFAPFARPDINLSTDRVSAEDGYRQQQSAQEILRRLARQPGVILADEVGMGKTFVAMAVAASIILQSPDAGPVVVMVPSSLRDKWPKDWEVFRQKCLSGRARASIRHAEASSGIEFLKLLDDPPRSRAHIIFLPHGALHRALTDSYAKLAVIRRAFKRRSSLDQQRRNFHKFAGRLLRMEWVERRVPGLLGDLFERPTESWLRTLHRSHPAFREEVTDDPVPLHLKEALDEIEGIKFEPLVEELRQLPLRESSRVDEKLKEARRALAELMSEIWALTLRKARFLSPLLILDEAHHLKNPATRLASLFVDEDAVKESSYFETSGALGGKFDRMLFLTATPFQLGHGELIRVLERFEGINWRAGQCPIIDRATFRDEISQLGKALDDAQASALRLDRVWGRLTPEHLLDSNGEPQKAEKWWHEAQADPGEGVIGQVVTQVRTTEQAMRVAEAHLWPWVLRHLKSRYIPSSADVERRRILPGAAINSGRSTDAGIEIEGDALFPFLLAGRAQAIMAASAHGRALFAEGLSSSFEAYFETRSGGVVIDEDGDLEASQVPEEVNWYLRHLDQALSRDGRTTFESHPKVRATAERAVQLWKAGEKVLIFCHYRATGRALRRHISSRLDAEITGLGLDKLPAIEPGKIKEELERIGDRFFDTDSALRNQVTDSIERIVKRFDALDSGHIQNIVEVVRRFLRTPSFLVRYFDLARTDYVEAFVEAIERQDVGGLSLRRRIEDFCVFLANRCVPSEREEYLRALDRIQVGSHVGREAPGTFDPSEGAEEAQQVLLLPNVRLVNGQVNQETRRRLLLAFNTPLFPEILIASSVLAEGVDLHLNCRYLIHHDLCWNPSTLEQRTGRVDRLGSKAEQIKESIHVYLPYIAATQDEKMYRVVRDRERWFQIVLGEKYEVDEAATDRRAERVPLPHSVQDGLILNLDKAK